jgi:dolichol-phosphate mannosyltransferase
LREACPAGKPSAFHLSIIVPCYNEQEVVRATYQRLTKVARQLGCAYELLFVDDGSRDATPALLDAICRDDRNARRLRLSRNFGHQVAVTAGLDHARGDAVVIIDADLQDPPEVIGEMVARWREGYDVVYGQRIERRGESRFKLSTAHLFYRLINALSEVPIPNDTGDFRLIDRRVVDALRKMPERHRLLRGMTSWVGFNQTSVGYVRAPRHAGRSKYPLKRMLLLALDGIVSFSITPLRLVTFIGAAMFGLSLLGIVYALGMRLVTDIWVPGWTLLFIGNLLFGGIQFIVLGILGEYIGRIYNEAKQRPLYFLADPGLAAARDAAAPAVEAKPRALADRE